MTIEKIERDGILYAILVHPSDMTSETTQFYVPGEEALQMGIVANHKGYAEKPHYHRENKRTASGNHHVVFMTKGKMAVDFYDSGNKLFKTVEMNVGDLILIADGVHRIRGITDFSGIIVKQGPFVSLELDKVDVDAK